MKKSAKKIKHSKRIKVVAKLKRPLKARRARPKLRKKVVKRQA
jgi:hypothetical protein